MPDVGRRGLAEPEVRAVDHHVDGGHGERRRARRLRRRRSSGRRASRRGARAPPPIASISASSRIAPRATGRDHVGRPSGRPAVWLAMAIDDPRAVEVIRGDLDPHPIPRQDPDAEAPHLAGHVAEHLVAVVELHPEHRVRERLHDLAFEFDFLFLGQELDRPDVRCLRALGGLAELVLTIRTLTRYAAMALSASFTSCKFHARL